ncbi:M23 family metallopeptidase [Thermus scotoductus]|uniref:Peptidase M23 n=3 Tax=Thermus scotoductus TaxID=37636 RepID=A0A430S3K9_THESC|nr:M23 family metallopeptidase [Thermus scotoductus]RTH28410.1 peptidase M23 [Thermus scotoductus]
MLAAKKDKVVKILKKAIELYTPVALLFLLLSQLPSSPNNPFLGPFKEVALPFLSWFAFWTAPVFLLAWLALLVLDRTEGYTFLIELPTLLSPVVWLTVLAQATGETLNRLRFWRNLPTPRTYRPQGVYRLPFQGFWLVANGGPDPETSHSWGILGQRYAYDFVIKDSQGKTYRTHGRRPEDYYAFGAPLLAPADGVVVRVQNRHRDCPWPGFLDPFAWSIIGNYVLIRHGEREYSLLAHLKRGSVRVKPGQWVRAGEVVGECGNSGHSTEPHLHFQFLDRPNVFLGLSLPIPFTGFLRRKEDGSLEATPLGFPIRGEEVAPSEQGLGQ